MARGSSSKEDDEERRHHGSRWRKCHRSRSPLSDSRRGSRKRHHDSNESSEDDSDNSPRPSPRRGKDTDEAMREYVSKKAYKMALNVAKKSKAQTVSGYTNDSNPFGDTNLTEKFVWRKKIERDLHSGMDPHDLSSKSERRKQKDRVSEIEKVKKRREQRAIEKGEHENEMVMLARERVRAEFQDCEKKEEEFLFEQSKILSEIRLREGRAKPIDVLSKNLNLSDDFDIEINEPYKIYRGLTVKKMEELRVDIKMHLELDRATSTHIEFWEAMMVVCDWEMSEARKRDALDRARVRGEEPPDLLAEDTGLHASVDKDVKAMLESESYNALDDMQSQIESQMRTGSAKVVEYWEAVLKRLHISKAKARLREIHADLLRQHLQRLKELKKQENYAASRGEDYEDHFDHADRDSEGPYSPDLLPSTHAQDVAKDAEGNPGSFSPELLQDYDGDGVVDPEADKADLERKRAEVLDGQQHRLQDAASAKCRAFLTMTTWNYRDRNEPWF